MLKVDAAIFDTNRVICKNISVFDASERGLLSQNILAQLRNFVEYIVQKIYSNGADTDPNDYKDKKAAWEYVKTQGKLRFLSKFHGLLQKSVSHYTFDEGGSERLMLKYYEYLLKIKIYLKDAYNMEVLGNIADFPLNLDDNLMEYYRKIAIRILKPSNRAKANPYHGRAYITKIKPFFVENHIFYEVTITTANDRASKFDRVIAFTNIDLYDNYAVRLTVRNDYISVLGKTMPVNIIEDWEVSIRPCEINRYADIFGIHTEIRASNNEYINLMNMLTHTRMSLYDLVTASDWYYSRIKVECSKNTKVMHIFNFLDKSRKLVREGLPGRNTISYLLYRMNHKVIRNQGASSPCERLSNLHLQWGCIPFETMPFATSLINHNPRIYDLFDCIDCTGREHELLARVVHNNTEQRGVLFTPIEELAFSSDIEELRNRYNAKLYHKHTNRQLLVYKNHLYFRGHADDTAKIIRKLKGLSSSGISGYTSFVESWLQRNPSYRIDSKEKLETLRCIFSNSMVGLVYGSAGTGKSTLINHISHLYNDRNKLYLANTNPAVDNMKRKVTADNREFKTVAKFLSKSNRSTEYDIIVIDECSTVSNSDMVAILNKAQFKLLVLAGDVFQIESILFGNWFSIARRFLPGSSCAELTKPYRTNNERLLTIWDRVRKLDEAILEPLVKGKHTVKLDETIFDRSEKDEIILCLNYDGLYGINNINRFLQSNNPNSSVIWGINEYRKGDPILFNESELFAPLIYNNMKGRIHDVEAEKDRIRFDVELDMAITDWEAEGYDFTIVGESERGNSIISFWIESRASADGDDEIENTVVPFQVAYAVSIHKAQGLEYKSVKIVITHEVEELITHNIFYTAITRAKEELKIYWTPETEKKVLENLKVRDYGKDASLIASLYQL